MVSTGVVATRHQELCLNFKTSYCKWGGTLTFEDGASLVQIMLLGISSTGPIRNNTDYTYWSSPVLGI
jgi:hypothetical protein